MEPQHDALAYEVELALELAQELRLEGDPASLEDAFELEVACSYWAKVLPEVSTSLQRMRRFAFHAPVGAGAALTALLQRSLRRFHGTGDHTAAIAQKLSTPALADLASRPIGVSAPAALLAAPVAFFALAGGPGAITSRPTPTYQNAVRAAATPVGIWSLRPGSGGRVGHKHGLSSLGLSNGRMNAILSGLVRDPRGLLPFGAGDGLGSELSPTLAQSSPSAGLTTTAQAADFAGQLGVSGSNGEVTFSQTLGQPALVVSASGAITTSGPLPVGTYAASGTESDASGSSGSWSFTLTVLGVPLAPSGATSSILSTAQSGNFAVQLAASGPSGRLSFGQASGQPALVVSPTGMLTTNGPLAPGTYRATGTTTDGLGDVGSWSYALTVVASPLVQTGPTAGNVSLLQSGTYSAQLTVGGAAGRVSFTELSGPPGLTVSASGVVSTSGPLGAGAYSVSGTDGDAFGDTGTWTFLLNVRGSASSPSTPGDARPSAGIDLASAPQPTLQFSSATTTANSSAFSATLVIGDPGTVFTVLNGTSGLSITPSGLVLVTSPLASGTYQMSGSATDPSGAVTPWTFTLAVSGPPPGAAS